MNVSASDGADAHDNFNPPRFLDSPELEFQKMDWIDSGIGFDMVSTQDSYHWTFTTSGKSGVPAMLSWNDEIEVSGRQLYLLDESTLNVIDMTQSKEYTFKLSMRNKFSVFYGTDVESRVFTEGIVVGAVSPNPITNTVQGTIPISLPDLRTSYPVVFKLFNATGVVVQSSEMALAPGIHALPINFHDSLNKGVYYYTVTVGAKQFSGKIIRL